MKKLRIVFISDTHGQHEKLDLPEGDMLIHSGDLCKYGELKEVEGFAKWLREQPFKYKIVVPGNHDAPFQTYPNKCNDILDCAIVASEGVIVFPNGLRISAHAWTPEFGAWSFMLPRGSQELYEKVQGIPECDILISHGPAHGVLDKTTRGDLAGCELLLQRIKEIQPQYLLSGHIHETFQDEPEYIGSTECWNGSQLDERYQLTNKPVVLEIEVDD